MEKRLKEINDRKIEIRAALNSASEVDLEAFKTELEKLNAEEQELRNKLDLASKINIGEVIAPTIKKPGEAEERNGIDSLEYRNAFMNYVKTGKMAEEFRAVSMTPNNAAVMPTTMINKIIEKMDNCGMILPLVTRTSYETGISIPTSTAKPVATFVAEGATSDKQDKSTASIIFGAYKLRCAVAVSLNLAVLSLDSFEKVLVDNISNAMMTALEKAIIAGTGTGEPKGIIKEEGAELTAEALDFDTIMAAEAELPSQYENGSVYVMSKKTFMQLRLAKDSNKRPILTDLDIQNKELLGRKVVLCDYLPSFATAESGQTVAFIFRMEDYILNTALDMQIKQYEDNDTDDIIRKAIMLVDGKVVDTSSLVKIVKA